jgi:hypothetical protein
MQGARLVNLITVGGEAVRTQGVWGLALNGKLKISTLMQAKLVKIAGNCLYPRSGVLEGRGNTSLSPPYPPTLLSYHPIYKTLIY